MKQKSESKLKQETNLLVKKYEIDIWRILSYFILYSILGYVIEILYGAITKGVLESRQSFLYGPFCAIYGVGACIMILGLQKFNKSLNSQFIGGFLIGSVVEYVVSFLGEIVLHVKWWDYSNLPFNINGRICIAFSVFWGILGIYLMSSLNPKIDRFLDKIRYKLESTSLKNSFKIITVIIIGIMFIDCVITGIAVKFYQIRKIEEFNLNVDKKEEVSQAYKNIYENEKMANFINKYWNDEKMIKTFPNLKIQDKEGNIIFLKDSSPDIEPYYIKIYNKNNL